MSDFIKVLNNIPIIDSEKRDYTKKRHEIDHGSDSFNNFMLHQLGKKWCEILDQLDLDWKKDIIFHLKLLKTQNYNGYIIESITIS